MIKKQYYILMLFKITILTGCATYSITTKSLVDQLNTFQKVETNKYFQRFSTFEYPSNNLEYIECEDKKGNYVWQYPDKNTELMLTMKTNGTKGQA